MLDQSASVPLLVGKALIHTSAQPLTEVDELQAWLHVSDDNHGGPGP